MTGSDTHSEEFRHLCEVRHVANLPTNADRKRYLVGVAERRGKEAAKRLRADAWALMQKTAKAAG